MDKYTVNGDWKRVGGIGTNFFKYLELLKRNVNPNDYIFYCKYTNEYCGRFPYYDIEKRVFNTTKKLPPNVVYNGATIIYVSNLKTYVKIAKLGFIKEFCGIKLKNNYIGNKQINYKKLPNHVKSIAMFNNKHEIYLMPFSRVGIEILKSDSDIFNALKDRYTKHVKFMETDYNTYDDFFKVNFDKQTQGYKTEIIDYHNFVEKQITENGRYDEYIERVKFYNDKNDEIIEKWDKLFLDK